METAESRAKLANAIRTMQANGQSDKIPSLVSAYKAKYQSTPVAPVPVEKTFGQKVSGGIQKIFPGQKVGQAIGTLAGYALTPKENRKYYDTSAPSVGQVLGDAAQIALTVGTAGGVRTGVKGVSALGKASGVGSNLLNKATIETAKTVGGRALQNTAIGAGFGATTGIKEGKDVKGVLKDTAMGAAFGLGTGLAIDGAIGAYKGIKRTPQKAVAKTEQELLRLENNYQKLRKNAKFSKDGNAATRKRIAQTGVMSDATDDTGTIITDKVIPRYRALSPINNTEGVVRKNLERLGETVDLDTVEKKLLQSVYDSGLQGANLDSAVNSVKKEIAGYRLRANPDGRIPLTLMHDAKIDVYNSIDFNTPAEIKAYKKTLAKGLKEVVEENSNFNVKEVNESLAPFLKDIEYLESLNGRKVKGGKLGKYSARIAGNIAGGIAGGSVGGLPGSAVGTIVGGEVGDAIQGKILKGTFGNIAETALPESKILKKAVQTGNSPRPQLPAPKPGQPRIQQVSGKVINLPKRTQSAVDAQSLANLTAQKIAPPSKIPSKVSISKSVAPTTKKVNGDIKPSKKGISKMEALKKSLKDNRGFIAGSFKNEGNLTTKILKDLEGKTTVSKQYILDATNRGELKQVERDITRQVLETMPDGQINVKEFADKVKSELLPLKVETKKFSKNGGSSTGSTKYESIALPDELRGNVANYKENIYESPIATSAGDVHFAGKAKNYFGHTRIEDMADNKTRRVIEVQSDLYQKGNLEREVADRFDPAKTQLPKDRADKLFNYTKRLSGQGENLSTKEITEYRKLFDDAKTLHENTVVASRNKELSKLQQYNDPTAHFRMIREEIKKASQDGKTKLQFPTGETAMKIEGLGDNVQFYDVARMNETRANGMASDLQRQGEALSYATLKPTELKVGQEVSQGAGNQWIITDVLGDGKFKAVAKTDNLFNKKVAGTEELAPGIWGDSRNIEEFDISGKVDTNNPIYKFYEKDVQKYLNKFGGKRVVDDKGVSWIEIPITKEQGKAPVEAFGKAKISAVTAGALITGAGALGANYLKYKKDKK